MADVNEATQIDLNTVKLLLRQCQIGVNNRKYFGDKKAQLTEKHNCKALNKILECARLKPWAMRLENEIKTEMMVSHKCGRWNKRNSRGWNLENDVFYHVNQLYGTKHTEKYVFEVTAAVMRVIEGLEDSVLHPNVLNEK